MSGHAERGHALLGASKASQWINCPPSARAQESIPDKRSAFADEGTVAHELSEIMLRCELGGNDGADVALYQEFVADAPHYNIEMREYCTTYCDYVIETYHAALDRSPDAVILLEEQLDFSEWVPEGFGTGDVVIISDGVMDIIDLKYGKGVPVSAEGNAQMRLYALGAWTSFNYLYDIQTINMTIVQPRLDNISTATMEIGELLDWADEVVKPAAAMAYEGHGKFKAGEHCRWCKIKGNCRARADENMQLLAHEFKEPALLSLEEIGPILTIAENLQAWAKDVQAWAFEQAAHGETIPGWKLVEGRSVRKILADDVAIHRLWSKYGKEKFIKPDELYGITELEKRIGKKELNALIGDLIVKPPGKPALVVETDKRPPINSVAGDFASEDFEDQ
jgi:hypothetical protein